MNYWFKKIGWIHYPVSVTGFIITFLILAFCIQILIFFDSRSHSVSDLLYNIFPFIVPSFLLYEWIASKKSK
jgi:hypothetical protein